MDNDDNYVISERMKRKLEYHDGFYCAGNNIPFDENQSEAWKEGYHDGWESLYDDNDNKKFYLFSGLVHKPVFVENEYGTYYNPKVDGQYSRPVKLKI